MAQLSKTQKTTRKNPDIQNPPILPPFPHFPRPQTENKTTQMQWKKKGGEIWNSKNGNQTGKKTDSRITRKNWSFRFWKQMLTLGGWSWNAMRKWEEIEGYFLPPRVSSLSPLFLVDVADREDGVNWKGKKKGRKFKESVFKAFLQLHAFTPKEMPYSMAAPLLLFVFRFHTSRVSVNLKSIGWRKF